METWSASTCTTATSFPFPGWILRLLSLLLAYILHRFSIHFEPLIRNDPLWIRYQTNIQSEKQMKFGNPIFEKPSYVQDDERP